MKFIVHHQLKLEETESNHTRLQELEKEVKEKNLLIGKLRHEGTIFSIEPPHSTD
jgi:hypothetical protein